MSLDQLRRACQEMTMIKWSATDAVACGLSEGDAEVLSQVGLPEVLEPLFAASAQLLRHSDDRYCKIGSDYGADVCIEVASGVVWSVPSGADLPVRFINSRLSGFVAFLCRVTSERRRFPGMVDAQIDDRLRSLEAELREADPAAFEGAENWWVVIFEQMRDGLL